MSAKTRTIESDAARTASTLFTTRNAPRVFCPTNTRPCPQMFADKWAALGEQ